ncbi:MAG: hypothetical protein HHJ17_18270 [Rhodoferax sp.]|uniref:hypothetical protein n=1 Tax=Rhodoferax sp. TaxID=50421 RepID=UPI0017F84F62|nr:hypothetical protein [Rhodoferax sp.]NMM15468.1 hypothetical protein [Rhodoferax sp.]
MTKVTITYGNKVLANNSEILLDSMEPNGTMILLNKFKVETAYFDLVESNFRDIQPFLLEGVDYTAEDLVGAKLWGDLTGFAQRHAHLCLKHMATFPFSRLTDMSKEQYGKTGFQIVNK